MHRKNIVYIRFSTICAFRTHWGSCNVSSQIKGEYCNYAIIKIYIMKTIMARSTFMDPLTYLNFTFFILMIGTYLKIVYVGRGIAEYLNISGKFNQLFNGKIEVQIQLELTWKYFSPFLMPYWFSTQLSQHNL